MIFRDITMMQKHLVLLLLVALFAHLLIAAPVDPKKKEESSDSKKSGSESELDDLGLEYGRYLQQVVQALEEDKEFAKKLENISVEEIQSGKIADHLEFVKHNVRTKLDELKRIEVDRLRKLVQEQMERSELGLYRDEDGRLLPSPDGRRWRTIPGHHSGQEGLDRKGGVKIPSHLDIDNMHTFEINDLKKLIQAATKDLEALDKKRREEFKKYEMEKELKYRDSLKNMTEEEKKKVEQHHEELVKKHKEHPKVHHPGSKPQLEQVWEEEDHMPKQEFNPRTFFAMHDINADGHLDEKEVEAVLMPEIRKMYDPKNEEDDPAEMEEEYHRMREHIFNETDKDKDGLISLEEFIKMTQQQEFEQDDGWKGLDEQTVYSEAELEEYMRQRQMAMNQQYYGDPRMYYDVPHAPNQGMPPNINYQVPHPDMQAGYPQYQQQVHPGMQQQYHQPAYGQQHQGVPPQNYQGVPNHQQFAGHPPQQQFVQQGHPQQQQFVQQGHPQQQQFVQQGHPQQQYAQQDHPQQQHPAQGIPQQQHPAQGIPQQQHPAQGIPQQQQHPAQGIPQQQQFQPPQAQQVPDQKQAKPLSVQEQQHIVQKQAPAAVNEIPNPPAQKVQSGQQKTA